MFDSDLEEMAMGLFAGIEAGGTKFMLGVGSAEAGSVATLRVETTDPDTTFAAAAAFFANHRPAEGYAAAGLASFGPVALDPARPDYGRILKTPKPGWEGADLVGRMSAMLGVPVAIDTDVNAAALAELRARGRPEQTLAYATIGTGVGVGLVVGGQPVHGAGHPEMGHILVRRLPDHRDFAGICPFHGDCLEGLASGPAIKASWGDSLDALPADHSAWAVESDYLAQLCMTLLLTVAPHHIVLGGGVMTQAALLPRVRARTAALIAGYVADADPAALEARIGGVLCREPPGLIGAYLLAEGA